VDVAQLGDLGSRPRTGLGRQQPFAVEASRDFVILKTFLDQCSNSLDDACRSRKARAFDIQFVDDAAPPLDS
jgi:hypothetical protein